MDCIINKIKSVYKYNDPNTITEDEVENVLTGKIRECLWTTDQVNRIKEIMANMTQEERAIFFRRYILVAPTEFTSEEIDCFTNTLKEYVPDPSIFKSAFEVSSPSMNIYSNCTLKRRGLS